MKLCEIEIKQIRVSGDNPRIISKKSEGFIELVESIKSLGVKVPIHVRERTTEYGGCRRNRCRINRHPETSGQTTDDIRPATYELLAGERRLLAAAEAKLDTIPAIDHGELSDEAAFEVTFAENFAREDLTILEQGNAVATLLAKYKDDVAAVASKLGKSQQWVRLREAIHTKLSAAWKKIVSKDPNCCFTAAHLGLIARFPQNVQDKDITKSLQGSGRRTVKELEDLLANYFLLLKKAPFDTAKCQKCIKRSGCQPLLWSQKAEEVTGDKNKCLDRKCWQKKEVAAAREKFEELKKERPGLVCIAEHQLWGDDARQIKRIYGQILSRYEVTPAKKTDKKAVPALIVSGPGKGKIVYVKVKKSDRGQDARDTDKPKTAKQIAAEQEETRWQKVHKEFYEELVKRPVTDIRHASPFFAVVALAAGCECDLTIRDRMSPDFIEEALGEFRENSTKACDQLAKHLWEAIRCNLRFSGNVDFSGDEESVKFDKTIASLFGVDLDERYKAILTAETADAAEKKEEPRKGKVKK